MPRTKTKSELTATAQCDPFAAEDLDALLDRYAQPIASEVIRERLPERVKHHIRRLLTSNSEADRAELLQIMQGAKLGICFAVYTAVLSYAREDAESRINGTEQPALPDGSVNGSDVTALHSDA